MQARWKSGLAAMTMVVGLVPGVAGAAEAAVEAGSAERSQADKVLQLPVRTDGPKSLDPVEGSTTYDNMACAQVYETLLTNKYSNPMEYEPLLLAELPTSEDEGKTWKFKLRDDIYFHDNACFPSGEGRKVVTDDVFYSIKRLADGEYRYENYWLIKETIVGLDEAMEKYSGQDFDYDAPIEGFRKISDSEFEIVLTKPVSRFLWVLTMFQTSVVPREAVEMYGEDFFRNAVGTGPFVLRNSSDFKPKQSLHLYKNPEYREVLYPARSEWSSEDRRRRMHRAAGERVPFVDKLEFTMYPEDQTMWLDFMESGTLAYTQVPDEFYAQAFDKQTREFNPELAARGYDFHKARLLDFIFRGFNMEDSVLGGYSADRKALRQAISLAVDLEDFNQRFYSGLNYVYDGPIPPGLDGFPQDGAAPHSYRGPNLDLARRKMAEAGYDKGIDPATGQPLTLTYYTSRSTLNQEMSEQLTRQLSQIGIKLVVRLVDFSTLIETVNKKNAQMFSFAWSSDYPDAENNLALFYGPNEAPGANHYNYKRDEYDALYEQILTMLPSPERTAIYEKMRDMLLEDVPYIGSMARTRHYLIAPWAVNCRPTERYYGWFKYVDVDESKRPN